MVHYILPTQPVFSNQSRIMRKDLSKLVKDFVVTPSAIINDSYTIEEAIAFLRNKRIGDKIIYIYVVDEEKHLLGVVPVRTLLLSDTSKKISDVMIRSVVCLEGSQTLEEAMKFLESHRLLALPVVDEEKRLLGVIDVDLYLEESLDVAHEKRRSDIFQMIGVYLEEEKKFSVFRNYSIRMPWIFCNMFGGFACAVISRVYELVLAKVLLLAMFIPLVLTLSESISMQAMTQSLEMTRTQSNMGTLFGRVFKRSVVVAMIAVTCGVIVGAISLFWGDGILPGVAITVGIIISVYITAMIGAVVPLALHAWKWDPRIASGPVVLMFADVITTTIYLSLATAWLI